MPHVALESDVREECQNILPIDFPDPEIVKELDAAHNFIKLQIGPFDATHEDIDALKKIEIKLASCFVLAHFRQFTDNKTSKCEEAKMLLESAKSGLAIAVGVDIEYKNASTSYESWPAAFQEDENTDARPYKSTNSFVY